MSECKHDFEDGYCYDCDRLATDIISDLEARATKLTGMLAEILDEARDFESRNPDKKVTWADGVEALLAQETEG